MDSHFDTKQEVGKLLELLPVQLANEITEYDKDLEFFEIVCDLDRPVVLRYNQHSIGLVRLNYECSAVDLKNITDKIDQFGADNRVGVAGTLHRISRILDKNRELVGLTLRVGIPFIGTVKLIADEIAQNKSVLIIGKPGSGKTSLLRQICFYLSVHLDKCVAIIDKSNEIAGESRCPHAAVGWSRRFQIPYGSCQSEIMIFALESHTPEVLVVDEISNLPEAIAAKTIAQRGVNIIATAHGSSLRDVVFNPELHPLCGGINVVTLSDTTTKESKLESKTRREKKFLPAFDIVVEITAFDEVRVYGNASLAIDQILIDQDPIVEIRRLHDGELLYIKPEMTIGERLNSAVPKVRNERKNKI